MTEPPGLDPLAQQAGLSRFQLVRQFARWQGLPPFAWVQQQRLRLARPLIAGGARPPTGRNHVQDRAGQPGHSAAHRPHPVLRLEPAHDQP